jgi:uncharacterized protein
VPKYQHRFCNTEYGTLKFDEQELAVVCELLLRGPQTPGELRSRASRMATLSDVTEVEAALTRLAEKEGGPFVNRLAREPGRRESRYAHLFSGEVAEGGPPEGKRLEGEHTEGSGAEGPYAEPGRTATAVPEITFPASLNEQRLTRLEAEVQALRAEILELRSQLEVK